MARHDLNFIRVLVALADTHHVSLAATRLGMTQPGVSNALRRMATYLRTAGIELEFNRQHGGKRTLSIRSALSS